MANVRGDEREANLLWHRLTLPVLLDESDAQVVLFMAA
jgi:hypothetical protein